MKYTKLELKERYRNIYTLKVIKKFSNEEIESAIPNCKARTIQKAIKYINDCNNLFTTDDILKMAVYSSEARLKNLVHIKDTLMDEMDSLMKSKSKNRYNRMIQLTKALRKVFAEIRVSEENLFKIQVLYNQKRNDEVIQAPIINIIKNYTK